ncbi:membrane-associated guanylate kinase, WW and PDZ domain-containing protein 1 isoform X1 [Ditylenchus destructor]|uniref:Membrane-associated guanylate kinase, WW and PDZ domain-containing protein 1 isoform X1 n=1 Tax=Ditylenchus destructor TaxID=166010 RepID=A0AAD4MRH9_9BILA|nr:membrane-associated guanylate kinase, WW and PDZ domain-containing protein 1 isoform X1 [Ditylenchus destructor]
MCLSNSIFQFCPAAGKELFNRFTLRDYFLSFVLPVEEDELFSDPFLDHCQLYDFQKIAKEIYDSTKKPTTKRSLLNVLFPTSTPKPRRIFSSDEDLADTPPNFYYSSAKYTKDYITYVTTKWPDNWGVTFAGDSSEIEGQPRVVSLDARYTPAHEIETTTPWHPHTIAVTFPDELPPSSVTSKSAQNYQEEQKVSLPANDESDRILNSEKFGKNGQESAENGQNVMENDQNLMENDQKSEKNGQKSVKNGQNSAKNDPKSTKNESYATRWTIGTTRADPTPMPNTIHSSANVVDLQDQGSYTRDPSAGYSGSSPEITIIDVYTPFTPDYYSMVEYSSTEIGDSSEFYGDSTAQSAEGRDGKSDRNLQSKTLFPIVFPVENSPDTSSQRPVSYSTKPGKPQANGPSNEADRKSSKKHYWVTTTQQDAQLPSPTPLFGDSRIHVKKIVPFDENNDVEFIKGKDGEKDKNSAVSANARGQSNEQDGNVDSGEADSYDSEDSGYYDPEDDNIPPYTIVPAHPDDITGKNVVDDEGDGLANKDRDPDDQDFGDEEIEPVTPYYANTMFVLFSIYSAFFLIALASLACLCLAYICRSRRERLKSSWISFYGQERF